MDRVCVWGGVVLACLLVRETNYDKTRSTAASKAERQYSVCTGPELCRDLASYVGTGFEKIHASMRGGV